MVRKITEADREFFLEQADIFYHTDAVEAVLPMKKLEAIFNEIMRSDVYVEGFIMEHEGKRAGYAVVAKTFQTEAAGLTVWIEDIYICPEFRSCGLGKEFFAYLDRAFHGLACRYRLEVESYNESAVGLYKKMGYRFLPYSEMVKDVDYD